MIGLNQIVNLYRRVSCVRRFGTTPCLFPENVSSHMYLVGLISLVLVGDRTDMDKFRVLGMSLTHDIEESLQGDVVATVKRFLPAVRDALDEAAREFLDVVIEDIQNKELLSSLWHEYKDQETDEAKLAKQADRIAQMVPMVIEHDLGNVYSEQILRNIAVVLAENDYAEIDEIRDYLTERGITLGSTVEW